MGIEPGSPALGAQSLSHWTIREVSIVLFLEQAVYGSPCGGMTTHTHSLFKIFSQDSSNRHAFTTPVELALLFVINFMQ